jgi:hypothetical protein
MWGCLKFMYEAPNQISLNWSMWSQTKACITKSCEICTFLRYYAAQSGHSALRFEDNLLVPTSRVKKCKTEHDRSPLTQSSFLGLCPSPDFLTKQNLFWFVYQVYEINSKIFFLNTNFIFGDVVLDLEKYIFPWQMCCFGGSS